MNDISLALLREDLPTLDLHGRSRWEAEYDLYHFLHDHPGEIVQIITGIGGGVVAETTHRTLRRMQSTGEVQEVMHSEFGGRCVVQVAERTKNTR